MTLVDTSAWVEALRKDGDEKVRERVAENLESGRAVLCDMVVLELWNGARGDEERKRLTEIFRTLERVATTEAVWSMATTLAKGCRQRGVTVPDTDLLVAATARVHGLDLLEADRHFRLIPTEVS